MKNDLFPRASKALQEKESILICLPTGATSDTIAAGTGLYLTLLQMGKAVSISSPAPIPAQFDYLGKEKIQTQLITSGNNLVVSFPYKDGSVDKVTYNIQNDKFNLVIQPREGQPKLDPKKVAYSYSGGKADVIVTLYAPTLASLGELYTNNKDQFSGVEIINVDRHFTNANYGTLNIVDKKAASVSEMILGLIMSLNIEINKDIATNLYNGIVAATNNFTAHTVNADTFEASAYLLKRGAVKKAILPPQAAQRNTPTSQYYQPQPFPRYSPQQRSQQPLQQYQDYLPQQNFDDQFTEEDFLDPYQDVLSQPQQPQQPRPIQQQRPQQMRQPQQLQSQQMLPQRPPAGEVFYGNVDTQQPMQEVENKEAKKQANTPKDWLKPKIFKGSNLI